MDGSDMKDPSLYPPFLSSIYHLINNGRKNGSETGVRNEHPSRAFSPLNKGLPNEIGKEGGTF